MSYRRDLVWTQQDLLERSSVAHQAARYALAVAAVQLPDEVVHQAKRCLLDALGCALASHHAPAFGVAQAVVDRLGGAPEATVIGTCQRTSVLNAALANSLLVRFLDLNDLGGGGHNSDAVASLLAVAEHQRSAGSDLLRALVVSYELGARFGESVTPAVTGVPISGSLESKGWTKDIRAGFSQPPALGVLLGLDEAQIANAVGICMSHTMPLGILDAHREENTMAKNIRFGWAAHDAIIACYLAEAGFTGPVRIIESDVGVRKVVAGGEMDLPRLTDFAGWRIHNVRFKMLAANGSTHGHVLATIALATEHDLRPDDVAEVRITAPVREATHTTAPPKKYPRNAESGDHSLFFANAFAIKHRSFGVESSEPEAFDDPEILELIDKISLTADPALGYYEGKSQITTADGRVLEHHVRQPHGFGDDPLTDAELGAKFRGLAERRLSAEQARRLEQAVWGVDDLDDAGELLALTVPDA
jgi:2-methylcitrate dehydratase